MKYSQYVRHILKWNSNIYLMTAVGLIPMYVTYLFLDHSFSLTRVATMGLSFVFVIILSLKNTDKYSWKYLQTLPIEKVKKMIFYVLGDFFKHLPMFIWLVSAWAVIQDYGTTSSPIVDLFPSSSKKSPEFTIVDTILSLFTVIIIGVEVMYFLSIMSFQGMISSSRAPYLKAEGFKSTFSKFSYFLYSLAGTVIVLYLINLKFDVSYYMERLELLFDSILALEIFYLIWFPLILIGATYASYRLWQNESFSYTKPIKNFKREGLLCTMAVMAIFQLGPELFPSFRELDYGRSPVIDAMFNQNQNEFYLKLKNDPQLLNHVSTKGYTPLMVAAHRGDERVFFKLLNLGATKDGIVNDPSDKISHGMNLLMLAIEGKNIRIIDHLITKENMTTRNQHLSLLHLAVFNCSGQVIDRLIELGVDVNSKESIGGKTPLHIAAARNCLTGAALLLDAGADPLIKDEKNKLARDYLKDRDGEFSFYLNKKVRSPAAKPELNPSLQNPD